MNMKYGPELIAIVVVVIAVIGGYYLLSDDGRDDSSNNQSGESSNEAPAVGGIVYSVSDIPVVTDSHLIMYPPEGMEYVTVFYIISNLYCDGGIYNNPYYFELVINGLSYSHDIVTYSHQLYNSANAVYPGYTLEGAIVFEIPEGIDISNATLIYDGIPHSGIILQKVDTTEPGLSL